jgi:hypothetical protein
MDAVAAQCFDVARGRGVLPHLDIHRRRDHQRTASRDAKRGQQVVREPVRELRHEVCRSRRNQDELAIARVLDMPHGILDAVIPKIHPYRLPRERLQRRGPDEASCRRGHCDAHVRPGLREKACQLRRLVGRDAAGDAEKDPSAGQRHRPDPRLRGNDSK